MGLVVTSANGKQRPVDLLLRVDMPIEVDYYRHDGLSRFVLRQLVAA